MACTITYPIDTLRFVEKIFLSPRFSTNFFVFKYLMKHAFYCFEPYMTYEWQLYCHIFSVKTTKNNISSPDIQRKIFKNVLWFLIFQTLPWEKPGTSPKHLNQETFWVQPGLCRRQLAQSRKRQSHKGDIGRNPVQGVAEKINLM